VITLAWRAHSPFRQSIDRRHARGFGTVQGGPADPRHLAISNSFSNSIRVKPLETPSPSGRGWSDLPHAAIGTLTRGEGTAERARRQLCLLLPIRICSLGRCTIRAKRTRRYWARFTAPGHRFSSLVFRSRPFCLSFLRDSSSPSTGVNARQGQSM
jgi:hypothetical protein